MEQGLSSSQVKQRLKEYGFNELPSAKPRSIWRIALEVVKEPMFLLLISCASLYVVLGDYREGIILLSAIFVIIGITFYQSQKTERALEALKNLSSPRALVIRDGNETRIAGREVVPGDVLIVNEGDRIAADATLIEALNLSIDESLLTGESVAVSKTTDESAKSMVFSGTLVVQGKGLAKVIATGVQSQFGKIGMSLKNIEQDETRLQIEMKALIKKLLIGGAFLSLAVVVAFYFSRGNFIQSLLNGLAASMAILPEEFPVVLTIFLALGAWRLSQQKVLTRSPSAIETLGSATVLCSDKTGTITQNKMEVAVLYDGTQTITREQFEKTENTFTQLLRVGFRASQHNSIDPMELAIQRKHEETSRQPSEQHNIVREYPLSKQLLAMTRVLQNSEDLSTTVSAKGAPETVFELCRMSEHDRAKHLAAVHQMAEQGYRVIAVAEASHPSHLPETQTGFDFSFLGLIGLEDPIRPEVPQAIRECREAGIAVVMITGDFPVTARSI
ncbi:MAG: HAD-IC family P-type ATPase, partial [Cyclobacteriaceae bacterium]|nr:HAD-IC family P-type ATPase [Cyclobacteriaceae bacterium]